MMLQELDFRGEADNVERIAAQFTERARRRLSQGAARAVDGAHPHDRVDRRRQGLRPRAAQRARRRSRAAGARGGAPPTASRSSPTASITPIRTRGTSWCASRATGEVSIVFIDFGAVAEVSPKMRRGIVDLIQAGIARDTPRVVQAMKEMGFIARGADSGDLRQGHRLLAPEVPGGDPARALLAQGREVRSAASRSRTWPICGAWTCRSAIWPITSTCPRSGSSSSARCSCSWGCAPSSTRRSTRCR